MAMAMPAPGPRQLSARPPEAEALAPALDIHPHPSPNFGPRRHALRPNLIVLHYTAMATAEAALARLCDPAVEVSAHYLICEHGRIYQLVDETLRAWHAGAGSWGGAEDINSRSVGIELANRGNHPFAAPQMAALEALLPKIMARWDMPAKGVIGHSDMAPGRKFDPGPRFDWLRLARQGQAVWPSAGAASSQMSWDKAAQQFGYSGHNGDVLATFRARFRPAATGPQNEEDLRLMTNLAAAYPAAHPAT